MSLIETSPLATKSATAAAILGLADAASQQVESSRSAKPKRFSLPRAGRFAVFGLVLQGPWNHFYFLLLDALLPPTANPLSATTFVKAGIDQLVQAPLFTVLIFLFLGALEGKPLPAIRAQLESSYWPTIKKNWLLWVPATVVNLGFVPPELRVLYINVVSFAW
ncbi:hypothetical protein TeGR_g10944 [Tetraparma gracilis]|uniref:Peroxisomal membrane protein 2 n=1 Tax=Tetraparma gracilis TaxID=2962635 RepID=A0ABQ6MZS1_9STRA|nr:hypothetical protein TeGR_g10944 [Tetraparma gracilis]